MVSNHQVSLLPPKHRPSLKKIIIYIYFSTPRDKVPTYIHFANQSGAFDDESVRQLAKQHFVVFEKDQGRWPQAPQVDGYPMDYENCAEQKINLACKQVKEVSPTTDCYMYTESDWARTQYSLGNSLDAAEEAAAAKTDDWRRRGGIELFCQMQDNDYRYSTTWDNVTCKTCNNSTGATFEYQFRTYDFRNKTTRESWVNRVVGSMMGEESFVDGAFIDGNRNGFDSSSVPCADPAIQDAWAAGLNESHYMLRASCDSAAASSGGGECTLISNYATAEALAVCDGGMIERFGCSVGNIKTLMGLASSGKLAQVHAQYADTNVATFNSSLACFLVAAGEYSYYGAGGGWEGDEHDSVMTSWLKQWEEVGR